MADNLLFVHCLFTELKNFLLILETVIIVEKLNPPVCLPEDFLILFHFKN